IRPSSIANPTFATGKHGPRRASERTVRKGLLVSIDPLTATISELSCYARSSRWRQTARRASHPDCMSIQRRKSASEGHESLDHVPYGPPHTLPCYRSWRLLLKSRNSRTGLLARATISCLPPILNRKQRMWAPSGNGSHLVKRTGPLQSD